MSREQGKAEFSSIEQETAAGQDTALGSRAQQQRRVPAHLALQERVLDSKTAPDAPFCSFAAWIGGLVAGRAARIRADPSG